MSWLRAAVVGCLLMAAARSWADAPAASETGGKTLVVAVAPPERVGGATEAEGEALYQAVVESLGAFKDVQVLERGKLKAITDELDLASASAPDNVAAIYASAARRIAASELLLPGICKIEQDYVLSLRRISLPQGATKSCAAGKTRLPSKFPAQAEQMVGELFGQPSGEPSARGGGPASSSPAEEAALLSLKELRAECQAAGAEGFFPGLWKRAETLYEKSAAGEPVNPLAYYIALLHVAARAAAPPEGMVFVPGGWVSVKTSAGARRLWVEPFFIDRFETTVGEYAMFLAWLETAAEGRAKAVSWRPITAGNRDFNQPALPVAGITWHAADAFARWRGKQLPTALQWLRAASGGDDRQYPCGAEDQAGACNLAGQDDGFAMLAPAAGCGKDVSPFGVVGMTGNVREWTGSWYADDAYAKTPEDSPREPADGTLMVVKGGGWRSPRQQAACAYLDKHKPGEAFDDVGFRCARPFFASVPSPLRASEGTGGRTTAGGQGP